MFIFVALRFACYFPSSLQAVVSPCFGAFLIICSDIVSSARSAWVVVCHISYGGARYFCLFFCYNFLLFSFCFLCSFSFLSFIECEFRACRIQYDDLMTSHCIAYSAYCIPTQYLCGVVLRPKSLYLSRIEASARTLIVLDVDR